jgi:pyridoxal phosphate enzyme (YggS family)
VSDIEANLRNVRTRIDAAARAAGREPSAIRLVAVSKTKPASDVRAAYAAGQRDFGENYVQELSAKAEALAELNDVRFHFIGHLQRNKAKVVARIAAAVHTVDSERLAAELGKRVAEAQSERTGLDAFRAGAGALAVLAEVNVGGEAQKSGASPSDLARLLDAIDAEASLRLVGLMTVPPHCATRMAARRACPSSAWA